MTKKLVPIGNHKEKDLRLIREEMLKTIKSDTATAKDKTDASKLLARMHKALQPDKTIEKPSEEKKQQELSDADKKVIEKALAGFN